MNTGNNAKMALKYSFKLIFLKVIFECVINTALQASNSVYGREKCSKCNIFTGSIIQWQCGPVIWVFFEHFFCLVLDFLSHFFPFASFPSSSLLTVFRFGKFFAITCFQQDKIKHIEGDHMALSNYLKLQQNIATLTFSD